MTRPGGETVDICGRRFTVGAWYARQGRPEACPARLVRYSPEERFFGGREDGYDRWFPMPGGVVTMGQDGYGWPMSGEDWSRQAGEEVDPPAGGSPARERRPSP